MNRVDLPVDAWCVWLPQLHRALADPAQAAHLRAPSAANNFETICAVWETLHYMLTALLGWSSPGRGLAWWYQANKPTGDSPHLRLLREHWDRDGALDYYAAWTWMPGRCFMSPDDLSPTELGALSSFPGEDWWRRLKRRGQEAHHDPFPFYGGTNALHLGHSDLAGLTEPDSDASQLQFDLASRRALLVVNRFDTWRHDLASASARLPSLGDRSWQVEIFDRHVGYLGLYRRSRDTGRWFAGRHSVHQNGQPMGVAA